MGLKLERERERERERECWIFLHFEIKMKKREFHVTNDDDDDSDNAFAEPLEYIWCLFYLVSSFSHSHIVFVELLERNIFAWSRISLGLYLFSPYLNF